MKMAPRRLKMNNLQSDLMQTPFSCKVERQRRMKSYQKLAFCPELTSGHIPISPVSRELDFATRAGGKFIVSRAGEALRCTSEKSKSEIPVENPWR